MEEIRAQSERQLGNAELSSVYDPSWTNGVGNNGGAYNWDRSVSVKQGDLLQHVVTAGYFYVLPGNFR